MLGGVAIAAGLERRLRLSAPSVRAVAVPESGAGRLTAVVAVGAHAAGEARAVALAALEAVNLVKLVTVVDDDVDPWDDAAVAHAVATRVHFDRDLHVLAGMRADRAEPLERDGTIAKLAIDATRVRRRSRRLDACRAAAVMLAAGSVTDYLVGARDRPARCRADRRGAGGRCLGHRPGRARARRRAGRQAGAAAAARGRGVDGARRGAPTPRRRRCGSPARLIPGRVPPVVDSDAGRARRRAAACAARLAQLAGRDARRARACRHPVAGPARRSAALHAATRGRRRGGRRVRRLRGLRPAAAGAVSRSRDGAAPRPRPCARAARRRAARQRRASCTATTHPRTSCSAATARGSLDAEVAHYGHPVFDLAFFLAFPLLTALEHPRARAGLQRARRRLRRGLRAPRGGAVPRHVLARGAHRRDAACAHRRPLAGDLPGARARPRRRAHSVERLLLEPTADLAAVVASCG